MHAGRPGNANPKALPRRPEYVLPVLPRSRSASLRTPQRVQAVRAYEGLTQQSIWRSQTLTSPRPHGIAALKLPAWFAGSPHGGRANPSHDADRGVFFAARSSPLRRAAGAGERMRSTGTDADVPPVSPPGAGGLSCCRGRTTGAGAPARCSQADRGAGGHRAARHRAARHWTASRSPVPEPGTTTSSGTAGTANRAGSARAARPAHHAGHPVGRRERHAVRADVVTSCVNPDGIIMTGHAEADSRPVSMKPFHPNLLGLRPGLRVGAFGSWGSPGARRPGKCRGGSARHGQEGDPIRRATGPGGRPDPNRRQRSTGCRQDSRTSRDSSVPGRSRFPHGAAARKDLVSIALGSSRNRHPLFARMTALLE